MQFYFRCFIFVLLIQIHTQVMKLLHFLKKNLKTKQTKDVDLFKLFSLLRQFYYVAFFNGQLKISMTVFYGIRCNKKVQKWQEGFNYNLIFCFSRFSQSCLKKATFYELLMHQYMRLYFKHNNSLKHFLTHEMFQTYFLGAQTCLPAFKMLWLQPWCITLLKRER